MSEGKKISMGIPDDEFIRGNIPMTKEEVRVITLSKLKIYEDSIVLDVGAGTGSISIECALIANRGRVYAVEVMDEGIELIKKNIEKFQSNNIIPIHGMAPEALKEIKRVDRIVIGGSRGNIDEIFHWAHTHLSEDGIIVGNFITIENLYYFIELCKKYNYQFECTQVSIAKSKVIRNITMMEGQNPVFIVKAYK